MRTDSYPRFLRSELYKTSVKCEIDGKPLPFSDVSNGNATGTSVDGATGGGRESIGKKSKVCDVLTLPCGFVMQSCGLDCLLCLCGLQSCRCGLQSCDVVFGCSF